MNTPLNLAHRQQRKAEHLLKIGKFDEAIARHKQAEEFLTEALSQISSFKARESLIFQRDYHIRQQSVIKHKQKQTDVIKMYQDNMKRIQSKETVAVTSPVEPEITVSNEIIQQAIRTMMEHDSLLQAMLPSETVQETSVPLSRSLDSIIKSGVKAPKDDKTRIEELRINNDELKRVLHTLINELEKSRQENKQLHETIEELQKVNQQLVSEKAGIRIPGLAGNRSLGVFSPSSDLKSVRSICELPALAPIEIAKFDYTMSSSETPKM